MNPALSQEFHLFCGQEQLQKHATLDKNPYYVYGTLNGAPRVWAEKYIFWAQNTDETAT